MREKNCIIDLRPDEHRLMVASINGFRNSLLKEGRPTEDVDELLLKVINAPNRRPNRKLDHETR